jgi:hypothetical protein
MVATISSHFEKKSGFSKSERTCNIMLDSKRSSTIGDLHTEVMVCFSLMWSILSPWHLFRFTEIFFY